MRRGSRRSRLLGAGELEPGPFRSGSASLFALPSVSASVAPGPQAGEAWQGPRPQSCWLWVAVRRGTQSLACFSGPRLTSLGAASGLLRALCSPASTSRLAGCGEGAGGEGPPAAPRGCGGFGGCKAPDRQARRAAAPPPEGFGNLRGSRNRPAGRGRLLVNLWFRSRKSLVEQVSSWSSL